MSRTCGDLFSQPTKSRVICSWLLQVPVTAVFVQLFASEFSQEAREEHMSLVLPKLLSLLWGLEHPSRLWLAYKVARKASIMVRLTNTTAHGKHLSEFDYN